MWDIFLVLIVILLILVFFYKQAVTEFRIHQVEASKTDAIGDLLSERIPLVLRGISPLTCWTRQDVSARSCYISLDVFREMTLTEWVQRTTRESACPWKYEQAEKIARQSNMAVWAKQWLSPFFSPILFPRYHCWAGERGLHKTVATWTCILPVEGEIQVTIMPESMEPFLPVSWTGSIPSRFTLHDTPFVKEIRFMDIIVRPGTCLIMPPHWFMSWIPTEKETIAPMVCTVSYHSLISWMAFHLSPHVRVM